MATYCASEPSTDYTDLSHVFKQFTTFRCSSVALPILIGDVNDNPPVFASPVIRLSIVENLSIGTEVALVEASDKDSKELYGQISYALDGFGSNDFIIDETTGQVKVDRVIDYESQQSYNVSVLSHLSQVYSCYSGTALVVLG